MSAAAEARSRQPPSAIERLRVLQNTQSIAIASASDKPSCVAYFVATYLLSSSSYRVYFVNPVVCGDGFFVGR